MLRSYPIDLKFNLTRSLIRRLEEKGQCVNHEIQFKTA